jgi:hypothetical protein
MLRWHIDIEILRTVALNRELNVRAKVTHEPTKRSTDFLPSNVKVYDGKFRYATVQSIVFIIIQLKHRNKTFKA